MNHVSWLATPYLFAFQELSNMKFSAKAEIVCGNISDTILVKVLEKKKNNTFSHINEMNTFGKIGREHELTLYLNQTKLPGWRNVLLSVKSNSNARLSKLPLTRVTSGYVRSFLPQGAK